MTDLVDVRLHIRNERSNQANAQRDEHVCLQMRSTGDFTRFSKSACCRSSISICGALGVEDAIVFSLRGNVGLKRTKEAARRSVGLCLRLISCSNADGALFDCAFALERVSALAAKLRCVLVFCSAMAAIHGPSFRWAIVSTSARIVKGLSFLKRGINAGKKIVEACAHECGRCMRFLDTYQGLQYRREKKRNPNGG